jgi:hypothetical protein
MLAKLRLFNPSPYARAGHVTIDWQEICDHPPTNPELLVVRDQAERRLPCQYDPVFPGRAKLSFTLADALPVVGADGYDYACPVASATVESGTAGEWQEPATPRPEAFKVDKEGKLHGVKLRNGLVEIYVNLTAAPWEPQRCWFSGAATSIVLTRGQKHHELLDTNPWEHAAEKRILHLDRLWLPCPAWSWGDRHHISLFDSPYEVFAVSGGPVRGSVTLASNPFDYPYTELGRKEVQKLTCRLFRVLSLYREANHVIEELFVRGSRDGDPAGKEAVDLTFAAHYFSYLRMNGGLRISRFKGIPDWFAITSGRLAVAQKFHCYGFATDVHTGHVTHPSPNYPRGDEAENTVSWELLPAKSAKCLHLFSFCHVEDWPWPEEGDFFASEAALAKKARREGESRAGRAWYEHIYKPLKATL